MTEKADTFLMLSWPGKKYKTYIQPGPNQNFAFVHSEATLKMIALEAYNV